MSLKVRHTDINKRATWKALPTCPICGEKPSYPTVARNMRIEMALSRYRDSDDVVVGYMCHSTYMSIEAIFHDFDTRLKNVKYFSTSFIAQDIITSKFYLIKWTTNGYRISGIMSDDYIGEYTSI